MQSSMIKKAIGKEQHSSLHASGGNTTPFLRELDFQLMNVLEIKERVHILPFGDILRMSSEVSTWVSRTERAPQLIL